MVPRLRPGTVAVRARRPGGFLTARLRIDAGFSGDAKPRIDAARARRGTLGRLGGTVSATGADGTIYALVVPPGALTADTAITLTPLRAIAGLPVTGPAVGVQFGPDGLVLRQPATLRITRKGAAPRTTVGYVYVGNGRDVALERARRAGSSLTIEISHFSGAGAGQITVVGFLTYVARLLTGRLTLADVDQFLHELGVVQAIFGEFCLTEATCTELVRRATELLEQEARKITCGSRDVGDNLTLIRDGLHVERNLRLVGKEAEPNRIARERACITNSLVTAAVGPSSADVLGTSALVATVAAADRKTADFDGDKTVSNGEWAGFLAGVAAAQGFVDHQARALGALETGLGTVLASGKALCDQTLEDGRALLERGRKLADATGTLAADFAAAIDACVPKVFVTPATASVEVGQTQAFAARSNEGDTTFDWTATDGTVDGVGLLTAPTKPGTITVTATVRRITKGTATVTVTCPAGQVEFQGECRTISVSVTPTNAAVAPSGAQLFTATVANATDQTVTWSASGGSISAGGLFTAPSQPGSYTVTARCGSRPDEDRQRQRHRGAARRLRPRALVSADAGRRPVAFARGTSISCPLLPADVAGREPVPAGADEPARGCGTPDSSPVGDRPARRMQRRHRRRAGDLIVVAQHDVQSTNGGLVASLHHLVTHSLTTHLTAMGRSRTTLRRPRFGLLTVGFDVIQVPVTLSCSTTLDRRLARRQPVRDGGHGLRAGGRDRRWARTMLAISDTTAPTTVVLQPGQLRPLHRGQDHALPDGYATSATSSSSSRPPGSATAFPEPRPRQRPMRSAALRRLTRRMAEPPPARVLFDASRDGSSAACSRSHPARSVPFDPADWRDAIVLVQGGPLALGCQAGGWRRFEAGAVLCLDGLALRVLRNPGPAAIRVVAVSRRRGLEAEGVPALDLREHRHRHVRVVAVRHAE